MQLIDQLGEPGCHLSTIRLHEVFIRLCKLLPLVFELPYNAESKKITTDYAGACESHQPHSDLCVHCHKHGQPESW